MKLKKLMTIQVTKNAVKQINYMQKQSSVNVIDDDYIPDECTENIPSTTISVIRNRPKLSETPRQWIAGDRTNPLYEYWLNNILLPISLSKDNHPLDFFQLCLDQSIIDILVEKTVFYAASENKPMSLSNNQMYTFLRILYVTGYNYLPRRKLYWEEADDVRNLLLSKIYA